MATMLVIANTRELMENGGYRNNGSYGNGGYRNRGYGNGGYNNQQLTRLPARFKVPAPAMDKVTRVTSPQRSRYYQNASSQAYREGFVRGYDEGFGSMRGTIIATEGQHRDIDLGSDLSPALVVFLKDGKATTFVSLFPKSINSRCRDESRGILFYGELVDALLHSCF